MTNPALLGSWIRRFLLEHLVADRNLAANTQKSYRDMLTLLLPFLVSKVHKPIDRLTIDDLSPQLIRSFLAHLEQQRRCTICTRNQRLAGIHAFARFIGEHSLEHIDWYTQIRLIPFKKTSQSEITFLEKPEMDALLAAPDTRTEQGHREYALLLFLYNSGARVSESVQLKIGDVDWHSLSIRVLGKGGKQRRCPLWESTLKQLHYLAGKRGITESMFLNRCHQPMTRSGIYALVKRCAARACAQASSLNNKQVGPHVIRHTTASHLLQAGVDINTIRGWLGHVSINTTNIYAETDLKTKSRALASCDITESAAEEKKWRNKQGIIEFLRRL